VRFALVFNPFKYKVHEENLKIVQKYFGLFPPLSLAWVAAIAEQAGHEVIIVDARTLDLSKEETLEVLEAFNPDIMGFMMTTYMFPDTLEWIKFLKQYLKVPTLIGGYNLRVYPKESVSHPEIDFGVVEHAYYTIPALFKELESKDPNFSNVPGLVYKKGENVVVTPHPQEIIFNEFPNPARHLLPNELYAEFPTEKKNFTVMVTSLGCPYDCKFCEASKTPYNPRSPELVVEEIEECYLQHGIREIDIFDYEFTGIKSRVLEICRLLQDKKINIKWACRSRVDTVDQELLEEMKRAGCSRIYFGLESGDQKILNGVSKKISIAQIQKTLGVCDSLGIKTLGFFLIGAPGDTKESIKKTIRFAKRLKLDYVQFSKCLAKPLTPLWKDLFKNGESDYWRNWIMGEETDRELPQPWTSLTNKEINTITRWAYISYYARPQYVLRQLYKLRSLSEFKRKVFAFFDMFFNQDKIARKDSNFKAFNENRPELVEKHKRILLEKALSRKNIKG